MRTPKVETLLDPLTSGQTSWAHESEPVWGFQESSIDSIVAARFTTKTVWIVLYNLLGSFGPGGSELTDFFLNLLATQGVA